MDDADYANERAETFTLFALQSALSRRSPRLRSTGICPSCALPVEPERLAADPYVRLCGDCASEQEDAARRMRRCGPR